MHTVKAYLKTIAKLVLGRGVRKSYGQFGEDALIQWAVKNSTKKTYVDVGAYHPTLYSNTYALYRLGWKGVVIDPNHTMRPLFSSVRPRDTFVCTAIGEKGSGTYYAFSDGAYNTFDTDVAKERKSLRWMSFLGESKVTFSSLKDILQKQGVTEIGFMNIDVEGRDMQVLVSHDWNIRPDIIAIEDEDFDADAPQKSLVYACLRGKNYKLIGFCGLTLVFRNADKQH